MKSSLILTFLILVSAAFVATWQKGEAGTLDEEHAALRGEVAALGLDPSSVAGERGGLSQMRLNQVLARVDAIDTKAARDARTRAFARTISEFAAEQKKMRHQGPPDAETQARLVEVMEGLLELQGEDYKVLLEAFRTDSSLSGDTRQELLSMAVMMLGRQNPQSALDLITESRDELMKDARSAFMVGTCLQGLAQKDPAGALAWMDAHKDLVDAQVMRQTLQGVAARDPALAMKRVLSTEGGAETDVMSMAAGMAMAATEAKSRDALLNTMRQATGGGEAAAAEVSAAPGAPEAAGAAPGQNAKPVSKAQRLREGILMGLGGQLAQGSFEDSREWLESGSLNEEEKAKVVDGIAGSLYGKDPAPWLDWMAKNLPEAQMTAKLRGLIPNWTRQDFNAVGAWLNGQPSGKPRDDAILSFAETMIPHEPEAAERWLESLPDSAKKGELMEKLHPPAPEPPAPEAPVADPQAQVPEEGNPGDPPASPPAESPEAPVPLPAKQE